MQHFRSRRRGGFYRGGRGGRGPSDRGDGDEEEEEEGDEHNDSGSGGKPRGGSTGGGRGEYRRYRPRYVRRGGARNPNKPSFSGNPKEGEDDKEHEQDHEVVIRF